MKDERPILRVFRAAFKVCFWALSKPTYIGRENIPATGPFLQVTNHLSYADPPLIFVGLERTHMVVLAADKYKPNPFFRWVIETAGGVWLNRGAGDRGALKAALEILKGPNILGMAPEGTRSKITHALQPGKSGAAFIASKAQVPIVPIGLTGTDKVFAQALRFHRTPVTFSVGKPFMLPPLEQQPNKAKALDDYTHEIMCRIAALLPEDYQGVYKGDPRIEEIRQGKDRW